MAGPEPLIPELDRIGRERCERPEETNVRRLGSQKVEQIVEIVRDWIHLPQGTEPSLERLVRGLLDMESYRFVGCTSGHRPQRQDVAVGGVEKRARAPRISPSSPCLPATPVRALVDDGVGTSCIMALVTCVLVAAQRATAPDYGWGKGDSGAGDLELTRVNGRTVDRHGQEVKVTGPESAILAERWRRESWQEVV